MLGSAIVKQVDPVCAQRLHDTAVALGAKCGCVQSADRLRRFNPNHYGPGERGGQFAPSGEGNAGASTDAGRPKPTQVASNGAGVRTDAGAGEPEQVAGGGEPDEESGRGRSPIEDEFVDPTAPIRQELYFAARQVACDRSIEWRHPFSGIAWPGAEQRRREQYAGGARSRDRGSRRQCR